MRQQIVLRLGHASNGHAVSLGLRHAGHVQALLQPVVDEIREEHLFLGHELDLLGQRRLVRSCCTVAVIDIVDFHQVCDQELIRSGSRL